MTRFEEIICSSETARAFMSVCVNAKSPLVSFINDWQPLIGAYSTLIAGVIGGALIFVQIYDLRKKKRAEKRQKKRAALIRVLHAVAEIGDYLNECFEAWEKKSPESRPKPPTEALQVLMNAAPYVESESFESFRRLIVCSQTFESRLSSKKKIRTNNQLNTMLADIAC
ncbi:hypothetical protein [Brucella thiophenivorans]|uniref:hypothetical protein n=1 Tax=Brucella thiophenivorans TaxID=571255 RepID=UPI000B99C7CE|nr:hypothetical protein [Brucella thiophenivorans]